MDHECQVGLVETHAQGRGRHKRLDSVLLEVLLEALPFRRVGLPGVDGRFHTRVA